MERGVVGHERPHLCGGLSIIDINLGQRQRVSKPERGMQREVIRDSPTGVLDVQDIAKLRVPAPRGAVGAVLRHRPRRRAGGFQRHRSLLPLELVPATNAEDVDVVLVGSEEQYVAVFLRVD